MKKYLFTSERLGFRTWNIQDNKEFAKINADTDVMEHFPKTLSTEETSLFIERLQKHYEKNNYCYFATEIIETGELIGFIGLAYQDYKTEYTPETDIGWRLKKSSWGKGYATEGAKRCLDYAFKRLNLKKIIATCTIENKKSENVMKKIGMTKKGILKHPKLSDYPEYENCLIYSIENKNMR